MSIFSSHSVKKWKYLLFDASKPIKPIWGVIVILAVALAFVFIALPDFVLTIAIATGAVLAFRVIRFAIRQYIYHRRFVKTSETGHVVKHTKVRVRPYVE